MTWADVEPCEVGSRVATHLRVLYPRDAAKRLASDFSVEVDTAKGWLSGKLPQNRHMTAMISRWGRVFLDFVYAPHVGASDVEQRIERVLAEMTSLRADLRRIRDAGNPSSRGVGVELDSDQPGMERDANGNARASGEGG